jgi:methionyl-tRNA synthetase
MSERIHITTAIFYCNAAPHVGSAYEALAADAFARYQRRKLGRANVTLLTGTDEHGDKIRRAADAQNLAPKAFTDQMSAVFRDTFAGLNISFDHFVRTTDPAHQRFVQQMLARTHERGDIYFKNYEGLYCVPCERFYTEKELLDGNVCPSHNRPVELISEANYFLKIEKYRAQIIDHIRRNPDFIRPDRYRNEALNMLAEPLNDLCISRPKSRLDWGVEIPWDHNYVTYVWYDAFWAYASAPAEADSSFLSRVWPDTEHFIGKDILKTHIVYWPAILLAANVPLFRHLNVHGWVNMGGQRMSKSSGNVADPVSYERAFGPDVLRYFLLHEFSYGADGDFSEERLIERYNGDLANNLGNLVSRVLSMATQYFEGEVKVAPTPPGQQPNLSREEHKFANTLSELAPKVAGHIERLEFKRALDEIWIALDSANIYVAETEPFRKIRTNKEEAAQILANLLEGLRVVAGVLEPFMPVTSGRMLEMLAVAPEAAMLPFGEGLKAGHRVKPPVALFPRIEKPKA